jgi:hypothetical protein
MAAEDLSVRKTQRKLGEEIIIIIQRYPNLLLRVFISSFRILDLIGFQDSIANGAGHRPFRLRPARHGCTQLRAGYSRLPVCRPEGP